MSKVRFRTLVQADFDQWNAVRFEALDVAPFAFGRSNEDEEPTREKLFQNNVEREDRFIIGAFEANKLIAIAGFFRHEPFKTFHKGTIWSVFVKQEFQGQGLGRKLMEETLQSAWKMDGLELILIGVSSNNPTAFNLYEKLGFEEYGREPNCLKHNGEYTDEILMVMHRY